MNAEYIINSCILQLMMGDITELEVDAIVNAANAQLILGGGVAGDHKAKFVIHAVGPRMGEGDENFKVFKRTMKTLL